MLLVVRFNSDPLHAKSELSSSISEIIRKHALKKMMVDKH